MSRRNLTVMSMSSNLPASLNTHPQPTHLCNDSCTCGADLHSSLKISIGYIYNLTKHNVLKPNSARDGTDNDQKYGTNYASGKTEAELTAHFKARWAEPVLRQCRLHCGRRPLRRTLNRIFERDEQCLNISSVSHA